MRVLEVIIPNIVKGFCIKLADFSNLNSINFYTCFYKFFYYIFSCSRKTWCSICYFKYYFIFLFIFYFYPLIYTNILVYLSKTRCIVCCPIISTYLCNRRNDLTFFKVFCVFKIFYFIIIMSKKPCFCKKLYFLISFLSLCL